MACGGGHAVSVLLVNDGSVFDHQQAVGSGFFQKGFQLLIFTFEFKRAGQRFGL